MASTQLDPRILRSSQPADVAKHLQDVQQCSSDDFITKTLFELIELESVAPTAFKQWLDIARSPDTVRAALTQSTSNAVRRLAIKKLRKLLSSTLWQETWDILGDTPGILKLLSDLSVQEVTHICRVFVRSVQVGSKTGDVQAKRSKFTELFTTLSSQPCPNETAAYTIDDQRQLRSIHERLISTCTNNFVSHLATKDLLKIGKNSHRLLLAHADILQSLAIRYVFENYTPGQIWLAPLLSGYPSATTNVPGISASMRFAINVLRRLATEDAKAPLPSTYVITDIVVPLLKKALRKSVDWTTIQMIMDLTLSYLERQPDAVKALNLQSGQFVHLAGVCWSQRPDKFEKQFSNVLSLPFTKIERKMFFMVMATTLLSKVSKGRRYALLKFYHQGLFQSVIGNADSSSHTHPVIVHTLLDKLLPPKDALALFSCMRNVKGDENLVDKDYDSNKPWGSSNSGVDVDMWHVILLSKSGHQLEAEDFGKKGFLARKEAAMTSPGQLQRAANARSAIDFAAASGSMDLCMESHKWARRFVRDPLTIQYLYCSTSSEGVALLSGIRMHPNEHESAFELQTRVEQANRIILYMFDTVCLGLREPAFDLAQYKGVLCLFASVVRERIKHSARLKKFVKLSDEELYQILWKDTLRMLISVEEKALSPGYEKLHLDDVDGALRYDKVHTGRVDLEDEEPTTFKFLDDLAKARDEMWQKHRVSMHPAVASLPKPFPRGLPIQHLIGPYYLNVRDLHKWSPYITARLETTIFPDPKAATAPIPGDRETLEAIGTFIDSYTFALHQLVPKALDKEERKTLMNRVCSYLTGPLCEGRFTQEEAYRYWDSELSSSPSWSSGLTIESQLPQWPLVPESEHLSEVEEWNPIPATISDAPRRSLDTITYIDLSKDIGLYSMGKTVRTKFRTPAPFIPAKENYKAFSERRMLEAKAHPAVREGQILSALLYVDDRLPRSQLPNKVFPCTDERALIRYPKVYLDGGFLSSGFSASSPGRFPASSRGMVFTSSRGGFSATSLGRFPANSQGSDAFHCLKIHLASVPPSLLAQMARGAYLALMGSLENEKGYNDLENHTLRLIKLLTKCDRPALALELVVQIVLDRPDNSSWHRQLLSRSFVRRLPASAAQDCMDVFAKAIITSVERQNAETASREAENVGNSADGSARSTVKHKTFVKVTTVKLLAQLLSDTQCISPEFALSVLSQLITKASHVDIRRSVVGSLLSMMENASPDQVDKVLTALENIIHIAGNIRERRPITEEEWTHSEDMTEPPDLYPGLSLDESAPILMSLISFLESNSTVSKRFSHQSQFVDRIIIPIVTSLKRQTAKWVSIFLRKHGFNFSAQQDLVIPPLPNSWRIMNRILTCAVAYLPLWYLEEFTAYRTFNLAPPEAIKALNKRLANDIGATRTPVVRSWLERYAFNDGDVDFNIISLLYQPTHLTGAITPSAVQECFLKLYTITLLHDKKTLEHTYWVQQNLWPYSPSQTISKSWADYIKPLVEAIIAYVESLRTRDWERDPNRHPYVLPNTFNLRMRLLQYAAQHTEHAADSEQHCAAFATLVAKILDQITGGLYHNKFLELKTSLGYVLGDDRLRVACHLGDISKTRLSWLSLQDHLRVELAASLLYDNTPRGAAPRSGSPDELTKRVEALRNSWRASESEEVRRAGCMHGIDWKA